MASDFGSSDESAIVLSLRQEIEQLTGALADAEQEAATLRTQLQQSEERARSLQAFKNSVDEALNSGNGSYRP